MGFNFRDGVRAALAAPLTCQHEMDPFGSFMLHASNHISTPNRGDGSNWRHLAKSRVATEAATEAAALTCQYKKESFGGVQP